MPAQAQKHVTVNESLTRLDALVQLAVESRTLAAQPGAPTDGSLWIVPAGKTGAEWGGYTDEAIGYFRDGAWEPLTPRAGWRAWVKDEGWSVAYDGAAWRTLWDHVDSLNGGPLAGVRNLIFNGAMAINQRAFAGGAHLAGAYGFDRWKAAAGGASVSAAGGTVTLSSGAIEQIIEAPGIAGATVTVSVEDPSATITVTAAASGSGSGSESGAITAGAGRRGVTFAVPETATGDIALRLAVAGSTTFANVQCEIGAAATPFERRPVGFEEALCRRYFECIGANDVDGLASGVCYSSTVAYVSLKFAEAKRAAPTITPSAASNFELLIGGAVVAVSSWGAMRPNDPIYDRATATVVTASGLTAGHGAVLQPSADGQYFDIDAEL